MTTTYIDPDGTGTNAWTVNGAASAHLALDDAVRDPTDARASGDGANLTSQTDEQVGTITLPNTLTYDAAQTLTLWLYGSGGNKRGVDIAISNDNGTTLVIARANLIGSNGAAGWYSLDITSGFSSQAHMDAMRVRYWCNTIGGGGGQSDAQIDAIYVQQDVTSATNWTMTHVSADIALTGGAHSFAVGQAHASADVALTGGIHALSVGLAQTSADVTFAGGIHTMVKSSGGTNWTMTHASADVALAGGVSSFSVGQAHTSADLSLAGGTHVMTKAKVIIHTSADLTLTGGSHSFSVGLAHTSAQLAFAGGVHTMAKAKVITHTSADLSLAGGSHSFTVGQAHTSAALAFAGGSHTFVRSVTIPATAGELILAGGQHAMTIVKALSSGTITFTGGSHTMTLGIPGVDTFDDMYTHGAFAVWIVGPPEAKWGADGPIEKWRVPLRTGAG